MKRISDKDASIAKGKANFDTYYWNDYGITATEDFIRQAQLEASEKEHKAVIKSLFEEIERERFETPQYIAESGSTPVIICLTEVDLQALKQKYGGK